MFLSSDGLLTTYYQHDLFKKILVGFTAVSFQFPGLPNLWQKVNPLKPFTIVHRSVDYIGLFCGAPSTLDTVGPLDLTLVRLLRLVSKIRDFAKHLSASILNCYRLGDFNRRNGGRVPGVEYGTSIAPLTSHPLASSSKLLDVLLGSIAEYFYESCRILASP